MTALLEKAMENKVILEAPLVEVASAPGAPTFGLPPEDERMPDLQYISAVLVSTGMNLNGAVFMPSELIKARDTMLSKPLDVEHIQHALVGHIYGRAFMDKERSVFEPLQFLAEQGAADIEKSSFDIAVLMTLYKQRFPDIADAITLGNYKVSMECFYSHFDVMIGELILSMDEAAKFGLTPEKVVEYSGTLADVVMPDGRRVGAVIGRVLRNLMFSGIGLVENPANPESIILEAAKAEATTTLSGLSLDLTGCQPIQTVSKNSMSSKNLFTKPSSSINLFTDSSDTAGAESARRSDNPGTCVSYKRIVVEGPPSSGSTPGTSEDIGLAPDDVVAAESYCALFETGCPARADATDARCIRNILGRSVKDAVNSMDDLHASLWFMHYSDEVDGVDLPPDDYDEQVHQEIIDLLK